MVVHGLANGARIVGISHSVQDIPTCHDLFLPYPVQFVVYNNAVVHWNTVVCIAS